MFKKKIDKEILEASVWEIQFLKLSNDHLQSVLDEVLELTDDNLIKSIIENWLERYQLDKIIHWKLLFK